MTKDNYGFIRLAAACPQIRTADIKSNIDTILQTIKLIENKCHPSVITFPELCVSGYTCEEMFNQNTLIEAVEKGIETLLKASNDFESLVCVGLPFIYNNRRYNASAIIRKGKLLGIVPKVYLPNSGEFYEARYFESGARLGVHCPEVCFAGQTCHFGVLQLFDMGKACISVEICQDLWVPIPPCSYAALNGANVILNLSASNETEGKNEYRKTLLSSTSARLHAAYVYASTGYGESSDDLVWGGSSMIYEDGAILAENSRFDKSSDWIVSDINLNTLAHNRAKSSNFTIEESIWHNGVEIGTYLHVNCGEPVDTDFQENLYRPIERHPFFPGGPDTIKSQCREVFNIQVTGLMTRLEHINCRKTIIGVSGGLDSTLALLVCCEAFDRLKLAREGIIAVTMPCFGTSERTHDNAEALMRSLKVSIREINISNACLQHMEDIGIDPDVHNVAYENAQARERTQVLMDIANNEGGIVVGTGDLSELALGWCTYNGDHMSMYGVNAGVPKTLIKEIVRMKAEELSVSDILLDIIDTPVSPELTPESQPTEDIVGPYELHDFFLWHFFDGNTPKTIFLLAKESFKDLYEEETILKWLKLFYKRFFSSQFKRSCLPNGPKTCKVNLSPRGDWRMSTDTMASEWIEELKEIEQYLS